MFLLGLECSHRIGRSLVLDSSLSIIGRFDESDDCVWVPLTPQAALNLHGNCMFNEDFAIQTNSENEA